MLFIPIDARLWQPGRNISIDTWWKFITFEKEIPEVEFFQAVEQTMNKSELFNGRENSNSRKIRKIPTLSYPERKIAKDNKVWIEFLFFVQFRKFVWENDRLVGDSNAEQLHENDIEDWTKSVSRDNLRRLKQPLLQVRYLLFVSLHFVV